MALTRLNSLAIPADTIVAADIDDGTITTAKLADSTGASDGITTAKIATGAVTSAKIADDAITLAKMDGDSSFDGKIITYDASGNPIQVGPGTDGQVLTSTGAGSPPAFEDAGGTYSGWLVKTANFTCANGDQLLCNHPSTAFTITLPAGSEGNTVVIANAGAATVTVAANGSEKINSSTDDGTLPQGNSVQLVYVDGTIGWFEI